MKARKYPGAGSSLFWILIAVIALIGVLAFIKPDPPREEREKLDWKGFLSLAIAVACIQLILDRGEREDWFASTEIIIEFCGAIVFGWIFLVHSLTSDRTFVDRRTKFRVGDRDPFGMLFVTPMVMIPAMILATKLPPACLSHRAVSALCWPRS